MRQLKEIDKIVLLGLRCIREDGTEGAFDGFKDVRFENKCCSHVVLTYGCGSGKLNCLSRLSGKRVKLNVTGYYRNTKCEALSVSFNDPDVKMETRQQNLVLGISYMNGINPDCFGRLVESECPNEGSAYRKTFDCVVRNCVKYKDGTYDWI